MRALVTGATGFVGSRLAEALAARGYEVRCLVRDARRSKHLREKGFELHEGDLLSAETLEGAGRGVDAAYYLVHLMGEAARATSPSRNSAAREPLRRWRKGKSGAGRVSRGPRRWAEDRAPAQPARDGADSRRPGAAADLLSCGDGRRGRQRVLPDVPLSRCTASRDGRALVAADPDTTDRRR